MDKKIHNRIKLELYPMIFNILINDTDSRFLSEKISKGAIETFLKVFGKLYNSREKESKDFNIEFSKELAVNKLIAPAINRTIEYIKSSLMEECISRNQIDKLVAKLNIKLKSNIKNNLIKIFLGIEPGNKKYKDVLPEELYPNRCIVKNSDYIKEDLLQRVNSVKKNKLKNFLKTEKGEKILSNISKLNNIELVDKLFSKESIILESIIDLSFSIDCKDEEVLDIISKSLGLLKMIVNNPKLIDCIKRKPKLLRLFKNRDYDSVVSNNAKALSDIFVKIPNRIIRSNLGQINISNDDYSRLNDRTKKIIDDYRTIMSEYCPENLIDVFESKIYSAISYGLEEDLIEEDLRVALIEHFANYYLDIFNKKRNQNLYESKMDSGLGKYFINNSLFLNAHKYALKELNRYILSEGLLDKLKKTLFGGKVSSGVAGKFNNWFRNTSVMKFMKKVSNSMDDKIEDWEKQLNPNQKKILNDYPHLKAVFATGGLDVNSAMNLIQNKSMLRLLNEKPNLAVIIANNPKVADLLLKRDKRLLPKILANPEIFDWLEDNEKLAGKILDGNESHLQVLQACILNFDLATKIANDEAIITKVGLDNIVDLAELMNSSSDLAVLLGQLNIAEFKDLTELLFSKPDLMDFFQLNRKGKELIKLAIRDSNDIIVKAIIENPDKFKEGSDITKIEGNSDYNKLLSKHLFKFKFRENSEEDESDVLEGRTKPKTFESEYLSIWSNLNSQEQDKINDFISKYRVHDCNIINLSTLSQNSEAIPQISDRARDGIFWMYRQGNNYKVVINVKKIDKIKASSFNNRYKYLFDSEGSREGKIIFIEPAEFKKEGENYSLIKKGKFKLDRV